MTQLSPAGSQVIADLAQRHGFSTDAVTHMLIAVDNGNGSMAQFNHHEFGGSGQWMSGGMTMIGDMFNSQLKYRVDGLCADLANELSQHRSGVFSGSFQSQSQNGGGHQNQQAGMGNLQNSLFIPDPEKLWWPAELGSPSASGSQNHAKYAYFSNSNRLAVATGGDVWVYDTLNHQIGGFSQQQSGDGSITFTSQFGVVALSSLPVVSRNGQTPPLAPPQPVASQPVAPQPVAPPSEPLPAQLTDDEIFSKIERLGGLLEKGFVTQDEFDAKKADLLNRL